MMWVAVAGSSISIGVVLGFGWLFKVWWTETKLGEKGGKFEMRS